VIVKNAYMEEIANINHIGHRRVRHSPKDIQAHWNCTSERGKRQHEKQGNTLNYFHLNTTDISYISYIAIIFYLTLLHSWKNVQKAGSGSS